MNQHGIRFSILDLGIMKSDINLVACGSVTATRSKPEDIRTVVLSHMHVDHTGYLYLFPHAEIIVQEKEFAAAFTYAFEQLDQNGYTLYMRRDITAPVDKYTLISGDYEICPGVKCISRPGHLKS